MVSKREVNLDILIVIIYVIMATAFVLIPPLNESSFRTILGVPLLLFIPGYVLTALLFPKRQDLDSLERIGYSVGLSIVIVPLIGYALNFTPWGIRLVPAMITLSLLTLLICVLAIIRRSFLSTDEKYYINLLQIGGAVNQVITTQGSNKIQSVLLTLLVIASVLSIGYIITVPDKNDTSTEFYIKGPDGKLGGFPTDIKQGESIAVTVGIINHESATVNYTLDILLENESMDLPDDLKNVKIAHNQTWEQMIIIEPTSTGQYSELKFLLYKDNDFSSPYRDLHLWVNVSEAEDDN